MQTSLPTPGDFATALAEAQVKKLAGPLQKRKHAERDGDEAGEDTAGPPRKKRAQDVDEITSILNITRIRQMLL